MAKTAAEKKLGKTKKEKDALRKDLQAVHVRYSISLQSDKSVFIFMHIRTSAKDVFYENCMHGLCMTTNFYVEQSLSFSYGCASHYTHYSFSTPCARSTCTTVFSAHEWASLISDSYLTSAAFLEC